MRRVATAAEMRALDAATIRDVGLPGATLMETAGRGAAAVVARLLAGQGARGPVAIVCGAGNNGGDGFVIARVLRAAGHDATAYLVAPRARVTGDAALHLAACERSGGRVVDVELGSAEARAALDAAIDGAAIIVDALFGTGLDRAIVGELATLVERINAAPGVRVAVDIPSGLAADTGHPLGVAVRADHTVTMGLLKVGIAGAPGFDRAGAVEVVDIGIPPRLAEAGTRAAEVERSDARAWLPDHGRLAHKGTRGHVLVVAGSPGKRGAARLTSLAVLRGGAGLCTLAAAGDDAAIGAPDAVMTATLPPATPATAADAVAALRALLDGKDALAIGPGMPDDASGRAWLDAVLAAGVPTVIDATGLTHLAGRLDVLATATAPIVLTPHPGEAARLLGTTAAAVEADRMSAVRGLAAATGATVLLKGARTLVCDATGFVTINPTGGASLATAGAGDVLTGLIAALLAQGVDAPTAARLGAYLHGAAGDALGSGAISSDLPAAIAAQIASLAR